MYLKADDDVIADMAQARHERVKVAVADLDGVLRGKYMHKDKFLSAAKKGFGFCSVIFGWDISDTTYDNCAFTGWHNGYPDTQARIDLGTERQVPWDDNIPFFLAELEDASGAPSQICPRQLLKRVIAQAAQAGFHARFGLEFEWFNFKETPQSTHAKRFTNLEPMSPGMCGYSILRTSLNQPYFAALADQMAAFKIPLEGLHTETGPGVTEAAICVADALEAADRAVLFKTAVKEIAQRHGLMATFMARWNNALPGNGGHMHQSLWDKSFEHNLFYNHNAPKSTGNGGVAMSELFRHYIAGQMALMPELLPFYAPNVNSYKRLVEGFWAPTRATWGVDNRTTALRVIDGGSKGTRLETRVGGADINPYLAMSAALASGLYGIKNRLELPDPTIGSAYQNKVATPLARNLFEATTALSQSAIARELFGETFVEHFVNLRFWEWRQLQNKVTDQEMERYFELV